jgi:hypothetical protein
MITSGVKSEEVAVFNTAYGYLSNARTLDDIKELLGKAEAAKVYAKKAKMSMEMINFASEIKLRAERKAGEMLRDMEKNAGGGDRKSEEYQNHRSDNTTGDTDTLSDIGVTKDQSSKWQRIANIPEHDFEAYIKKHSHGKVEITDGGLLNVFYPKEKTTEGPTKNFPLTPEVIRFVVAVDLMIKDNQNPEVIEELINALEEVKKRYANEPNLQRALRHEP